MDDRDDIEGNVLDTISSVNPNVKVYVHWFDSNDENYWSFYHANHKSDDPLSQLDMFRDYVLHHYYFSVRNHNDYHILAAEGNWDGGSGAAYSPGHFALASDDNEKIAAHGMGHMLGASHNRDTNWFSAPIMYPHPSAWYYHLQTKFWSDSNKSAVRKTLQELKHFPDSESFGVQYASLDSTTNARKYNGLEWNESRAEVYQLMVAKNTTYTITLTDADFDTYLYVYDENGKQLAKDDDSGPGSWSKLENQDFGSAKEVYFVVSGYKRAYGKYSIRMSTYRTLFIEGNSTLRSLQNSVVNLSKFISSNNKVWIKTHNGAWVESFTLPPEFHGNTRKVTLSVNSEWPVRVTFTANKIEKTLLVQQGQEVSWVNTGNGWLVQ
ncbi:hypothetical protein THERMOT_836 [Bathymodiolus thermophilus thioautotrophic gill symbiont]|uniref:hypothetical protein n=1 Tax=Bathymodiolus thermophilus thioautotrophic gill symbiont TaxID=2360 RepID=UPI00192C432A|nr:hypothetical protein [Bathymodiolus thermophilus thioautotrophic gill symbiont]CAB5498232.1 hypothetical protein THERMOT_836 [Bathymodiolus thermophilus thioautotrophic gill symbiont]